jgi:lipoate-protein ligase B
MKKVWLFDLGKQDFFSVYRLQKILVEKIRSGQINDCLLFVEHFPVITLGSRGTGDNLRVAPDVLRAKGISFLRVDRGGDITFHGPGQLVAYPIFRLEPGERDIHLFLRRLEEAIINFLGKYGLKAERIAGKTGVWWQGKKIAFIGLGFRNWVSYHGVSINIDVELENFAYIFPCGMRDCQVVSLAKALAMPIDLERAKQHLKTAFSEVFQLTLENSDVRQIVGEEKLALVAQEEIFSS